MRLADFAFSKLEPLWSRNCHIPCSVCATAQEISRTVYILILSKTSCTNTRAGAKALAHKNSRTNVSSLVIPSSVSFPSETLYLI